RNQRVGGLGTEFDRFLEVCLCRVPQLPVHLENSQIQIGVGAGGIQLQGLLHVRQRRGGVIRTGVVVRPCDINVGVVGLFLLEQVEMLLRVIELPAEDQQVSHVKVRGILVGLELNGSGQLLK